MTKVKRVTGIFFFCMSIMFAMSFSVATGADREGCTVCGMYIDQYQKTAGKLEYKDGRVVQSCGLACLLRLVDDAGGPDAFKSLQVKDWVVGLPIAAKRATYVISSKVSSYYCNSRRCSKLKIHSI